MAAYIDRRNRAFEADDLEWARKQMPTASSRVVEMAFHKARYECRHVSDDKRHESQRWLVENRVARMDGSPVILGEPLPE